VELGILADKDAFIAYRIFATTERKHRRIREIRSAIPNRSARIIIQDGTTILCQQHAGLFNHAGCLDSAGSLLRQR